MERTNNVREQARRFGIKETNHWHCSLLRARRERPRDSRATEKRDEFASFHRITSRQASRS